MSYATSDFGLKVVAFPTELAVVYIIFLQHNYTYCLVKYITNDIPQKLYHSVSEKMINLNRLEIKMSAFLKKGKFFGAKQLCSFANRKK